MRVKLLPVNEKQVIRKLYVACRTCYSAGSPITNYEKEFTADAHNKEDMLKLINYVMSSGHTSILEDQTLTFLIEGVDRACYDDTTEVLTKEGWKLFKDVSNKDLVATRNKQGLVEFHHPVNFTMYNYKGDMHSYKNDCIDLLVTPNHNLFVKKYDVRVPVDFELVPSENINIKRMYMDKEFNWDNTVSDTVTINGYQYQRKNNSGGVSTLTVKDEIFDKTTFTKFLAMYLSEGSVWLNEKEHSYRITIAQASKTLRGEVINEGTREDIFSTIKELGCNPWTTDTSIDFKSLLLGKYLKELGCSSDKYFPFNIFEYFNKEYAKLFIDTYVKYDGTEYKGHKFIYTTSEKLRDQIQIIAHIAGYGTSIYADNRVGQTHELNGYTITHNKVGYRISLSTCMNKKPVIKFDEARQLVPYDGKVYCLEVPNHVIYVRRNGLTVWCGNCTHQLVRHRAGVVFQQQSQRYVEFKDGNFDYVIPKSIEVTESLKSDFEATMKYLGTMYDKFIKAGVPAEDARAVLPNACCTNIVMTVNLRQLGHMCNERLCSTAQLPIRNLFKEITKQTVEVLPFMKNFLVPKCEMLGYCNEPRRTCGRKKLREEVIK